jgi:cytochrome P450
MEPLTQFLLTLFVLLVCALVFKSRAGPKKKACTAPAAGGTLPIIGHMHLVGGRTLAHKVFSNMADKYGPVFTVKLGSYRYLVINNWEVAKECFTVHDKAFSTRPSVASARLLGYNCAMFGLTGYGDYWRKMRKLATIELLSNHRLDLLKHKPAAEVDSMMKELYKVCGRKGSPESGTVVDMKQWYGNLTLNIAIRMVGGKRYFGTDADVDEESANRVQKVMREVIYLFGVFVLSDALPFFGWLDTNGYENRMKRAAKELDRLIAGWLEEHKQRRLTEGKRSEEDQDFMDVMLNTVEDAKISQFDADTITKATCLVNFSLFIFLLFYLIILDLNLKPFNLII